VGSAPERERVALPPKSDSSALRHEREAGFAAAASTFCEFGMPFWLAVTLLEHGE